MKDTIALYVFGALLWLCGSCTHVTPERTSGDMMFHVDTARLAQQPFYSEIAEIGVYPPAGWEVADSRHFFSDTIVSNLFADIKAMYYAPEEESMLLVQDYPSSDTALINRIFTDPNVWYNSDAAWISVMTDRFTYKNFPIRQIVLQNPQIVVFKIFISHKPGILELNYVVKTGASPETMKSVESSIGSVYSLTN